MKDIIIFKNIVKKFPGVIALNDVTMSIKKGEIHAIVGENGAGKSTLIKILSGIYRQNSGEIFYKGNLKKINNPLEARLSGIATVWQEPKLCHNLNIVENIYLGREEKSRFGRIDWKSMNSKAIELIRSLGCDINTKSLLSNLSVAELQIVEIARAISIDADVLILDEPTSSLTMKETQKLFENLKKFIQRGVTILFISHRLDEVFEIADQISVLRDGKYLGTYKTSEIKPDEIVNLIAGKELTNELHHKKNGNKVINKDEVALEIKDLWYKDYLKNINFKLYKEELLGIYGLQGSGRTELLETIYGLSKQGSKEIKVFGKKQKIKSSKDALINNFALIPEDRRKAGIFENMDIKDNIAVIHNKKITTSGFISKLKILRMVREFINKLDIKTSSPMKFIGQLSGGNQQKVIIARFLSNKPKILLLDEPTKGIDVGAKAEIFKILRSLIKDEGLSIIMVSSEIEEVISECDRVLILRNGKIAGEVEGERKVKEKILQYAFSG